MFGLQTHHRTGSKGDTTAARWKSGVVNCQRPHIEQKSPASSSAINRHSNTHNSHTGVKVSCWHRPPPHPTPHPTPPPPPPTPLCRILLRHSSLVGPDSSAQSRTPARGGCTHRWTSSVRELWNWNAAVAPAPAPRPASTQPPSHAIDGPSAGKRAEGFMGK